MLKELGISFGTAVMVLISLYFVVKWAVRNAINESREEITEAVRDALNNSEDEEQ